MRSLSWKLGGALLLIVVVSVGLMAYLTNRSTAREFRQYVMQGNIIHAQLAAESLGEYYAQGQSWQGVQGILPQFLMMGGERLVVVDSSGVVVGDTGRVWLGETEARLGLSGGEPVIVSGREVGRVYVLAPSTDGMMGMMSGGMMGRGMMGNGSPTVVTTAEEQFFSRVNRSLWVAGLVAAAVALLLGLLLTRQITRPVRALTRGARQISKGNLDYRVKASSKDELGELVQSFNSMAASLAGSEQARRRLTADIAHELRTPLTVIEGTVDGMLDGVFPPDSEHLTSIKEQTALLTRLIGDLRDISLAEAGQLKLERAPTDMVELVRRKLAQVEVKAQEKGVALKLEAHDKVPEINVDYMRIEQVITNLLTNAIYHTPAGGSVTVSIGTVDADREHQVSNPSLAISVADTGEGIAPEHLPHIFERFYRVGDSRARSEGGTGLGLAIVKHLVQAHGGKVWATSQAGKGSTFTVALPLNA
ncbi:MAG: HAMP domain-containing protein [Chloroflexi bacterium]|nr:HAMP domain-containing protein [Chloroflexota bacterium]